MSGDLRPALASLWRSRTSTAESDFLCSAAFVAPGLLLTAGHVFDERSADQVFVRPSVDATLGYPIAEVQRHGDLDAAVVRIERHPPDAAVLPLLVDPGFQPGGTCTLNGYFEGRAEAGLPLQVLNWDPTARWFITAPRQPAGHSGSAICADGQLWGLTVEHYVEPAVDRGCAIAVHQLWRGWLEGLIPYAEVVTLAAPAVTEMGAFVGETDRGPARPTIVCSWTEYLETFGQPLPTERSFLGMAVRGFFDNGGTRACVVRARAPGARRAAVSIATDDPEQRLLVEALNHGAFGNDLLVGIEPGARIGVRWTVCELRGRTAAEAAVDPVEDDDNLSIDDHGPNPLLYVVPSQSRRVSLRWENAARPGAMPQVGLWLLAGGTDGTVSASDLVGERATTSGDCSGLSALDHLADDISLVCIPDAVHDRFAPEEQACLREEVIAFAERWRAFAVLALPAALAAAERPKAPGDSSYAAVYLPWVTVISHNGREVDMPAVGHVAGALARHTASAGVHRAPCHLVIHGILRLAGGKGVECTDARAVQALERSGINALCFDAATGSALVASAVTMSIDYEWKPIRVRRFRSFVERHVDRLLAWASVEPQNEATWADIKSRLEAFLASLWRDGALAGSRPEEAYFVRCDRSTMTDADIDNGRIVCIFGYALHDPDASGTVSASMPVGVRAASAEHRRAESR